PDERLVSLVEGLRELRLTEVVVVDDGSGPGYAPVFAEVAGRGAHVVRHERNRGKGAALRTGFAAVARLLPFADVVTADADGQHTPAAVAAVAARLADGDADIVLGARSLAGPGVPARSRLGNAVRAAVYRLVARQRVTDTQTGLRGFRATVLGWLATVGGD